LLKACPFDQKIKSGLIGVSSDSVVLGRAELHYWIWCSYIPQIHVFNR